MPRRIPNKLYVGDLLEGVTKEDLEREFGKFGRLQDVWLAHNPPGFAFVEFYSSKDASDVVQAFDGRQVLGSRIRVEFAKSNGPVMQISKRKRSGRPRTRERILKPTIGPLGEIPRLRMSPMSLLRAANSQNRLLPPSSSLLGSSIPPLMPQYRSPSPLPLSRRARDALLDASSSRFGETLLRRELDAHGSSWDRRSHSPLLLLPPLRHRSRSPLGRHRYLSIRCVSFIAFFS